MAWYRTGTVAVTLNSATVTGTGTSFVSNVRVGDGFQGPDGRWYEVTNIASATVISITPNYLGATATGQSYSIAPLQGYVKQSADSLRTVTNQYGTTLGLLGTPTDTAGLRTNIGAAKSGANNDITSITGLTTALSVEQGGTGAKTAADARTNLGVIGLGQFGLGGRTVAVPTNIGDIVDTQHFSTAATTTDVPIGAGGAAGQGYGTHLTHPNAAYGTQDWTQLTSLRKFFRVKAASVWTPWAEIYHTRNAVGTVSQSSGVPTGAIIERGSNANGDYVKYADGTLICWGDSELAYSTSSILLKAQTFPTTFVSSLPAISVSISQPAQADISPVPIGSLIPMWASRGYSAFAPRIWKASAESNSFTSTSKCVVSWIATGRWF